MVHPRQMTRESEHLTGSVGTLAGWQRHRRSPPPRRRPPRRRPAEEPRRLPRWRRILVAFLVVLGCVLAPISIIAVWTHNTLLNTDQYVDTVGPLVEDPAIQDAIANRVTQALVANVDIDKEVKDALPERAAFAAPFVAQGIERFVNEATLKLVQTDQFQSLWDNVDRRRAQPTRHRAEGRGHRDRRDEGRQGRGRPQAGDHEGAEQARGSRHLDLRRAARSGASAPRSRCSSRSSSGRRRAP